ncbi:MAG: BatD family protein [Bacteroidales bacterium]|nr:BatD family protein [Bacteroidales bacterium]
MKKSLSVILLVFAVFQAFAQTSVRVQAPNLVGVNEQFNVTFVVEGENAPSSFEWNVGDDFQLVWGPQKGSSTSISIVNGTRTKSSQTTYTYVLMPKKTGKFEFPSAVATIKGSQIRSAVRSIEVVSDGASSQPQQGSSNSSQQGQSGSISSEDIFLKLILSKSRTMVGETITATLKLYQRVNIAGFEDAKFPTFNGFWSQEVQAPTNIEFVRESVGDKIYNSAVLRSWSLIPQQSGDIRIDPAELVCLINVRNPRASTGSIFDSFFQDEYQTVRKRVATGAVTVHVSGLPAGAPASFKGGVGSGFKLTASLSRDSLKTHDAASLIVTVTGKGNTSLLEAPKVNFPPDFEVYDVKTTEIAGGKSFEYPFIPRSHGEFEIDPVEYSYYDISAGKYVTLRSQPLSINVSRSGDYSGETGGQIVQGVNRKDVRDLGSDIRFISTKVPSFSAVGSFFVGSTLFWLLTALLAVAACALYFSLNKLAAMKADVAGSKNRAATKMARKRLYQAGDFLKKNLYTAFYEELHKALLGFISDKLNMDAADMSKENISAKLRENGSGDALADEFVSLLDACEFARYSPDAGHEAMNAHYESAVSVISSLDDKMKRKHKTVVAGITPVLIALLLGNPVDASADSYIDSLWVAGTSAYAEGYWEEAAQAWSTIRAGGLESPELYYNIGNAYFKSGDISHAILNYERALKLDPSYADARFNLEFANARIQDKIEVVPEFFLEAWGRKACWLLPSNIWAILFIVGLAITLALALMFVLGRNSRSRKIGFFAGIVMLILSLVALDFALWQRSDYRNADKAIVVRAVASVKSSPSGDASTDLFILHEGTKVTILDSVGEWLNVELSDGRQGWLRSSELEII